MARTVFMTLGWVLDVSGEWVPAADARVSAMDRGLQYGDGIFETLRVYDGAAFRAGDHWERLRRGARILGLSLPWTDADLDAEVARGVARSRMREAALKVVVTRGTSSPGLAWGADAVPTRLAYLTPLPRFTELRAEGARVIVHDAPPPCPWLEGAKTLPYLDRVVIMGRARERGANDAILTAPDGRVTETTTGNLLAYIGGRWLTPPLGPGVFEGITRRTLLELGLCEEHDVSAASLVTAEELASCSSIREIVGIVRVNDLPIGTGVVGQGTQSLHRALRRHIAEWCNAHAH